MLLDRLTDVLAFDQVDDGRFIARFGEKTANRAERASDDRLYDFPEIGDDWILLFGSYSMALALVVSGRTVSDELVPMSARSLFLRTGIPTEAIEIHVERDNDSRRLARRKVRFSHGSRVFFSSDLCFQRPDPDDGWHQPPIYVPAPAGMTSALMYLPMPVMELRPLAGPDTNVFDDVVIPGWFRFPAGVPESPTWGAAAQAWVSDYMVAQAMLLKSGRFSPAWHARTLEHTMWFHRPINPADWLLLNMTPTSLADHAYLATGTIHDEHGALGATIVQAGIFVPDTTA